MGHNSVVSGHLISTSFSQVDGWSTAPPVLGRHSMSLDMSCLMRICSLTRQNSPCHLTMSA